MDRERLLELLDYNQDSGVFTWKVRRTPSVLAGAIAGCPDSHGYTQIKIDKLPHLAHRLAFLIVYGSWPEHEIDHANGVRTDNRINNLRQSTRQKNTKNKKKYVSNTSGTVGVHWDKANQKFLASIMVSGKRLHLGRFKDIEYAIASRKAAERRYGFDPLHGAPADVRASRNMSA